MFVLFTKEKWKIYSCFKRASNEVSKTPVIKSELYFEQKTIINNHYLGFLIYFFVQK